MHIESAGVDRPSARPCFGWGPPHIYINITEIFTTLYNDCKLTQGIAEASAMTAKDA